MLLKGLDPDAAGGNSNDADEVDSFLQLSSRKKEKEGEDGEKTRD